MVKEDQHATVNCYKVHLPITTVHIWTQRNMLIEEEDQHKSSRTRDESQRIAGQAYSHAYNTPFKSSRLQGIPDGHYNSFPFDALRPRPASGPRRIPTQAMIRTPKKSIVKSNHAADYISSFQRGFRLRGVQPLSHAWQLLSTALSGNRIYQSCESTVPLVLSWITVTTNLTCISVG